MSGLLIAASLVPAGVNACDRWLRPPHDGLVARIVYAQAGDLISLVSHHCLVPCIQRWHERTGTFSFREMLTILVTCFIAVTKYKAEA